MTKLMTPENSRSIAQDMSRPPFLTLSLANQFKLRNMCGTKKIMTYEQYIFERDKLINKQDEKD